MLDDSDDCEHCGDCGGRADYLGGGGEADQELVWVCLLELRKVFSFFLSREAQ